MLSTEIRAWLLRQGWGDARPEPVVGGTNNSVYRVEGLQGPALLKISKPKPNDPRDRFGAEKDFYDLLEKHSLHGAPRRYAFDESLGAAIYEWLEGSPVKGEIGKESLKQAVDFLVGVQHSVRQGFERKASEACFSWSEHESLIDRRLLALDDKSSEIGAFVRQELLPLWQKTKTSLKRTKPADFSAGDGCRILSPGDFGFHNALLCSDGSIVFFDFEYSGWDDPAKTVADIFLQPETPVDLRHWAAFCAELLDRASLDCKFPERASALLPLFGVKWACILLGSLSKRSGASQEITAQIGKCRRVLGRASELRSFAV
jgi:Ser/Thr protein kinase RdoA (MazF antagonist)